MTAASKSRMREAAIQALVTTATIAAAAAQCAVSERTILRWLAETEFQQEYKSAKGQLLEAAVNCLRTAGFDAAQRLHKIVIDPDAPVTAAVSASGRLLELLLKATEIEDLSKRLDRLEASMRAEQ